MMRSSFKAAERSFSNLQTEVGQVLDRLWRLGVAGVIEGAEFSPPIELREEMDHYELIAELPGISLSLIEVTAGPSSITIAGDKVKQVPVALETTEPVWPRLLQDERRYGRFTRTISLPGSIRVDAVTASMADGILTVQMPKVVTSKPVEVRVDVTRPSPPCGPDVMT